MNAYRLTGKYNDDTSQFVFNNIIEHLSKKKKLKDVILNGINHKTMSDIMYDVMDGIFHYINTNKKSFLNLNDWWAYSKSFLETNENATIILSLDIILPNGSIQGHLTTISSMTDKTVVLLDSSDGVTKISKRFCKLANYPKNKKYTIYPAQCWYLR